MSGLETHASGDALLRLALAVLAGAAAAAPLLRHSARGGPKVFWRLWAAGLVVAALVYVALAAVYGRSWLGWQLLGLGLYSAIALAGLRRWPRLLAAGWALHVAWDLLGHPVEIGALAGGPAGASFMPWWYPPLCVGFDLLVAGFLWASPETWRAEAA